MGETRTEKSPRGAFGELIMFYFLIEVLVI